MIMILLQVIQKEKIIIYLVNLKMMQMMIFFLKKMELKIYLKVMMIIKIKKAQYLIKLFFEID